MTVLRGEEALESGLVRLRGAGGIAGAGFLVAPDIVCTCAHVVADALQLPWDTSDAPTETVRVEFPLLRGADGAAPAVRARVVSWRPVLEDDSGDVALLRLDAPVPDARPVPLVDGTSVWGHSFRAYGFPGGGDHGVWATGMLRSVQGAGWLQMDTGPGGPLVSKGYSGAAVWDDVQGGVVGLAVAAGRGDLAHTAFLVPSAALTDEAILRPACPFRGLEPFEEKDAEFFHGRECDTGRLAASVDARRLTLVVGPSGSGKSSLIRAGLLPRLRAERLSATVLRPVPGVTPETLLAHALVPVLEPETGEVDKLSRAATLAQLLAGESGDSPGAGRGADRIPQAVAGLRAALQDRAGTGGHLIVVDQLEEYTGAEPAAARTLLRLLLALTDHPREGGGRGLRVVATARQESLDVLLTPETSGTLSDAVLFLAPLDAESLYRAVTGPVDAVPGLRLEPGLAERIVADAADQPGRMPLVEFTLTRLWERHERSLLTHAVYDELGGVAGTLVGYADEAYRAHVPASEEVPARRLFMQLARPDDQGGYSRRATLLAHLDPAAVVLARRLARGKLVIIGHTAQGAEIVDLTHEALTRLWPRLHTWLEESRNFRVWQEQLRTDMARWVAKEREAGALQRGKTLAEGVEWLQHRPEDMTADERAYIEAGRRHAQGTVRRLVAGGVFLMALLVVAVVLGVLALGTSRELAAQVRTLAARALAEESGRRQAQEPGTAVQFALAAWHADRKSPHARAALLSQYVRAQYARGIHTGLWRGRVQELDATPDGSTLVVRSKPQGSDSYEVSVVTGALAGKPQHYRLADVPETQQDGQLSPDGRYYGVVTPDGAVRLWRLDGKGSEPTLLSRDPKDVDGAVSTGLDFSPDGRRLLRLLDLHTPEAKNATPRSFIGVWDLNSLQPVPVADSLASAVGIESARFGKEPGTVEISTRSPGKPGKPETTSTRALHDLRTGAELRKLPAKGNDDNPEPVDATGGFSYSSEVPLDFDHSDLVLRTRGKDDAYMTRVPVDDEPGYQEPKLVVARGPEAGLTVLALVGDTLVATHARPVPRPVGTDPDDYGGVLSVMSPDGRRVARLMDRELQVVNLVHGGTTTDELPEGFGRTTEAGLVWTHGSDQLVLSAAGGSHLHVYDADTLSDRVDIRVAATRATGEEEGLISMVAPLAGGEIAVLTRDGELLRVDPEQRVQPGRAVTVDPDPYVPSFPPSKNQLLARPGHPHQVAVVTLKDQKKGRIQIWDLRTRTRTQILKGDEISSAFDQTGTGNLAFSPDGRFLAVSHNDGKLHRWNVEKGRIVGAPIEMPTGTNIVGTADAVTVTSSVDGYELWSTDGSRIGIIPRDHGSTAVLRGTKLITEHEGWRSTLDVRPETWSTHLCATTGRAFTQEELKHLPEGAPVEPPCA
ncbi:trypsin-like peptidase domain-containing protein [Streptomyces sp. NPDC005963]|uniref:nSTAND1 domain-containing NTPase n=1 Tax=Streptomyces sp. NPDC005963 TaxID=3156721 RepID=UPI0033E01E4E